MLSIDDINAVLNDKNIEYVKFITQCVTDIEVMIKSRDFEICHTFFKKSMYISINLTSIFDHYSSRLKYFISGGFSIDNILTDIKQELLIKNEWIFKIKYDTYHIMTGGYPSDKEYHDIHIFIKNNHH